MSKFNLFIVVLLILTMLPASTSVSAQSSSVTPATNGVYDIFVKSSGGRIGTYTIRTGASHPVTLNMGQPQSVLYGGATGSPSTSFNTIRSYTSNTDYVTNLNPTSGFTVVNLDAYSTGTVAIGTNEIQTTWELPGPPATPDRLQIIQSIRVQGTTFYDSSIAVNIWVTNLGTSPVALGIRYLWDVEIGADDGPILTPENIDGTENGPWQSEKQSDLPAFYSYLIQDNDLNPSPPTFGVHGTVTGPTSFVPTAPSVLQFASWPLSFATAFDYEVDPTREIATNGGDSAVIYLFGHDLANARTIAESETLSLVTSIFATPDDADLDGDRLLDSWELTDMDMNGDGIIDVGPSVGSYPNKKDIYVEVDWMAATDHAAHKPDPQAIQKVVAAFAAQNINLHVDAGPSSIDYVTGSPWGQNSNGNEYAHEDLIGDLSNSTELAADWERLRMANFGHSDRIFRHAMFVHTAKEKKESLLGKAVAYRDSMGGYIPGQYLFVALGTQKGNVGTVVEQASVFMHELGHTLGLQHGGNEVEGYKPNYLSVMNYSFATNGLNINGDAGQVDYSRFDLPDLDEINLLEAHGLNDTRVGSYKTKYRAIGICNLLSLRGYYVETNAQPINWDCDLGTDNQPVQIDINQPPPDAGPGLGMTRLTSWDDWSNLNFKAGNIGAAVAYPLPITLEDLANYPEEITFEEDLHIQRSSDPRVQLTEIADVSSVQAGGIVTYTITMLNIDGQDANDVVITETIPAGFNYVLGSTSGATTTDPVIDGQNLSWSSFIVPANGDMLTLSFQVAASQIPGIYSDTMSGSSSNGYVVSTGDTAQVEVIPSSNFPSTPVLDNFNRANGSIGSSWSGYTSKYHVTSNRMTVDYNGSNSDIYWNNLFGADQEAYVTFTDIDATASEHDLLLKAQSNTTWGDGVIEVLYDPTGQTVQVWTYEWPDGWVQHGADIPVTFVDGDRFGARALANGTVEVYKNGTLLTTRDITSWSHYADGGYIGLWFIGAEDAVLDDFGGGTISGGTAPMSMLGGPMESETLTPAQLNVNAQDAVIYWQGIPLGSNQPAEITFANVPNKQGLLLKPQSNGVWDEGVVEVLYDVAGQRIQVWMYDEAGNDWVQYGKDIPVKFAAGDIFSVQVLADGTVEVYRNEKLLAKRDVTP